MHAWQIGEQRAVGELHAAAGLYSTPPCYGSMAEDGRPNPQDWCAVNMINRRMLCVPCMQALCVVCQRCRAR